MKNSFLPTLKRATLIGVFSFCSGRCLSQANVIADKDNTRPEISQQNLRLPFISDFIVEKVFDHNEISWKATREDDVKKYILEYSLNGVDYNAVGEVIATKTISDRSYTITHNLKDGRPITYRIQTEQLNGKSYPLATLAVNGQVDSPVKIYPTILTTNTINVNASRAVNRINIYSGNGAQVFAQDVNGRSDYMAIVIPSLGKGLYWMVFYGEGWQATEKFIIP